MDNLIYHGYEKKNRFFPPKTGFPCDFQGYLWGEMGVGKDLKITVPKGTGHFKARGAQQPGKGMQQTFLLSNHVSVDKWDD